MINLEKVKYEKCQPPFLRRPALAPYFHRLFKIFQIPPSRGANQNLPSTPGLNYAILLIDRSEPRFESHTGGKIRKTLKNDGKTGYLAFK